MLIMLSGASDVPLYQQIVDQIRAKILAGELAPGAALPSIRQLAANLLTSVITTKRAYQELEAGGLITTRPGLGTFVSELTPATIEEIRLAEVKAELQEVLMRAQSLGVSSRVLHDLVAKILEEGMVQNETKGYKH